jgi:hypothetical protein
MSSDTQDSPAPAEAASPEKPAEQTAPLSPQGQAAMRGDPVADLQKRVETLQAETEAREAAELEKLQAQLAAQRQAEAAAAPKPGVTGDPSKSVLKPAAGPEKKEARPGVEGVHVERG